MTTGMFVTNIEGLDWLPGNSVVLPPDGIPMTKSGDGPADWSCEGRWWDHGQVGLPAAVLYRPDEPIGVILDPEVYALLDFANETPYTVGELARALLPFVKVGANGLMNLLDSVRRHERAIEAVRSAIEEIRDREPAYWTNTIVADTFEIALAKGLGTEI